jgi:hypothetical protein
MGPASRPASHPLETYDNVALLEMIMPQGSLELLRTASKEQQVIDAVHAYVAGWVPAALARLPLEVRPSGINDADDVARLAVEIAQCRLDPRTDSSVRDVLDELHPYFTEAAARLTVLQTLATNPRIGIVSRLSR